MQSHSESQIIDGLSGQFWTWCHITGRLINARAPRIGRVLKPAIKLRADWCDLMNTGALPLSEEIIAATEFVCGLPPGAVISASREKRHCEARHAATRVIRWVCGRNLCWIGARTRRDRSSVRHSLSERVDVSEIEKRILSELRRKYPHVDRTYAELKSKLDQEFI